MNNYNAYDVANYVADEIGNNAFKTFVRAELEELGVDKIVWSDLTFQLRKRRISFLPALKDSAIWTLPGQSIRAYRTNTLIYEIAKAVYYPADSTDITLANFLNKFKGQHLENGEEENQVEEDE